MGNNLVVLYKEKVIAELARKHNFTFYGDNHLPTEDEIIDTLNNTRKHVIATVVAYSTWLASQEKGSSIAEKIDDIVRSVKEMLNLFEDEVVVAARNWVLQDLQDQITDDIEVIDEYELERRRTAKAKYYEDLHLKIEKVNWDAVEDQTGEVDLSYDEDDDDFDEDTLVGPKWEEPEEGKCGSIKIGEKLTKGW